MKGNLLPTFQTFSVSERVQVKKLKEWDVKIEPSNAVADLLGVTEPIIIPDNFESSNRLPLKPPNERYVKPNFALTNGPSPLSHAHRGIADKSNLNAPRERKIVDKTVSAKNDPQQSFKIENGSSKGLDIYVQTPFAVRSSELGPHCVWTKDISGTSSGKLGGTATKTITAPVDADFFRVYSAPAKDLIVSMTGKQTVKDYAFGPGPIGMQVEISEVEEQKQLCCTNVVEGSQAWQFNDELSGAVVLAVNGQRVLSLLEFQTAVTVAKDVVGQVVIKALSFRDAAARAALQQKWNLKKNKNIKSLLTGSLGMFGGGDKKGAVEVEEDSDSDSDDDSDDDSNDEDGPPGADAPPPPVEEEEDSDEEDDILYRRHRRFKKHQELERHHEHALGISHRDPAEEQRLGKQKLRELASQDAPDCDDVYRHEAETPNFKKKLADPDEDLLFSPDMPAIKEFDSIVVESPEVIGNTEAPAEDQTELSENEDGMIVKAKPRRAMSFEGSPANIVRFDVELDMPGALEPVEELVPAPEEKVEELESPDPIFLTGTNIVDEFTDLTPYKSLVCPPELFGSNTSSWGNPSRYCQFQNFSAFCKVSVYWVDEDDTLVLRKVLYPFDEPHIDMVCGEHTWVLTTTRLRASRLVELKDRLKQTAPNATLKATTGMGGALVQENEDENEELDESDIGLNGLPRPRADGGNSCFAFRPSDAVVTNQAKSLSVIWIPEESVTLAQRMRTISTLYKVPQHHSRHNPLHQRRPDRRVPPPTSQDDINRQNPNMTLQIFDPRVMKAAPVPNSAQGKRALASSRPSSGPSTRPPSQPR